MKTFTSGALKTCGLASAFLPQPRDSLQQMLPLSPPWVRGPGPWCSCSLAIRGALHAGTALLHMLSSEADRQHAPAQRSVLSLLPRQWTAWAEEGCRARGRKRAGAEGLRPTTAIFPTSVSPQSLLSILLQAPDLHPLCIPLPAGP